MTDGIEEVRSVFEQRETIPPIDQDGEKIGSGSANSEESGADLLDDRDGDPGPNPADYPDGWRGADPDGEADQVGGGTGAGQGPQSILPPGFPVQPLGMAGGKFYFLTARGELVEYAAGALSHRSNLVALMAGEADPIRPLKNIAPPSGKRDTGFNAAAAGDQLMQACGALPLFDRNMPMRNTGTWRGKTGYPIVHLGEDLMVHHSEKPRGRMISGALYPAVPAIDAPARDMASADDIEWVCRRIGNFWNWKCENAGPLVIGFIGQAVLGHYPDWRTHLWVNGKNGSGKSSLLQIISALLGGMSAGVKNSSSAASIRQTTNRQAVVRIFDEAEKSENGGGVEDVIAMFRLMSGAEGAQMERGTSDHSGIKFGLYGAGLLGSIIPGGMAPQDRSRFVMLTLGERVAPQNPEDAALRLVELEEDAKVLGPSIWKRMLKLAPRRYDQAFRIYNGIVQGLGGRSRDGDTVGAILAGWDLMMFDGPLVDKETGQPDEARLEQARALARPLLQETQEADEMGEGERLLNTLYGASLLKEHGGVVTVAESIMLHNRSEHELRAGDATLLERLGLRLLGRGDGKKELFIANAGGPQLDKALAGTRWRGGGHKAALQTIADVKPHGGTVRVAGKPQRGVIIPARFLPGYIKDPKRPEGAGQ
ncbi:ATP-binding protein [Pseudophaeobacter sp.]|uniref:ATP-binding protein n=1 Tax=Pseudophaeobacter sp. TaxID=1971739 RepID=UPI003267D386